ncbi:MAG: hypothetical protein EA383_11820 [Spirochaetaceae bacterium]|nr:MAG: hypothetical protein EA383_11820 [Spirochaetaceae bacterium]
MNSQIQIAKGFINRLLANPALKSYTPLQKEEQILQFLNANGSQLMPTLRTPQFFGGIPDHEILSLLFTSLTDIINTEIPAFLDLLLDRRVNFDFISFMTQKADAGGQSREQVRRSVETLLTRPESRRAMTGPLAAVYYGLSKKYLDELFQRRGYTHFELTKVQRLRMGREHVQALLDVNILLKPAIYLVSGGDGGQSGYSSGLVQPAFAETARGLLVKRLPAVPDAVVAASVRANMSFVDNPNIEATSRLASIFSSRARGFQPNQKVDRGADTPDKSWFSVARRNYKFYGFDVKILDELYSIAAELMW